MARVHVLIVIAAMVPCGVGCRAVTMDTHEAGMPPDASVVLPADLTAEARDMAGDLASPRDLSTGDMPDIALPVDFAGPCRGGFVNAPDAATACPLMCGADVESVADEGAIHVPLGSSVPYRHNPPASGNHWPFPAPWGIYQGVVPREWWVHNLEHGGIVLLYNCPYPAGKAPDGGVTWGDMGMPVPNDCAAEIAQLAQLYSQHPMDNFWDQYFEVRMVVTADPLLPKRFAAIAWDWVWMADSLDLPAVKCFIGARYGQGPEYAP